MIFEVYLSKAICINSNPALFYETSADACKIVADSLPSRVWQFQCGPYKRAAYSHVSHRRRSIRKRRWIRAPDADAIKPRPRGAMHVQLSRRLYRPTIAKQLQPWYSLHARQTGMGLPLRASQLFLVLLFSTLY